MQLLTTKEVCNMLRISIDTLHRWRTNIAINFPKPIKVDGKKSKNLWQLSDIEEFIKKI